MLIQRVLCRSWHRQITECTYTKRTFLLHQQHVRCRPTQPPQNWLLRPVRTSAPNNKPPRVDSLNIKPFEQFDVHGGSVPPNNVIKAVVFAGTFTMGCFMGATIMEYENTRSMMMKKARESRFAWGRRTQTETNLLEELRQTIAQYWNQLTPGERVFAPLCALNLIVFGLWRVPALRNTMMTYFCSNPAGRAVCWPMFLSTFSHYSAFHLFANMYVLHSFSSAAVLSMGKEQFLAVYLSAGVLASLSSIMYKAVTSQAGLSIGASGAIMAILAYVCSRFPDTQLSILFLPTLTFSAGAAIKVIMGIDLAGCIMGWKFFDHAAHLGGAMFGIFWSYFGADMWQKRITFLSMYHDWRKTK